MVNAPPFADRILRLQTEPATTLEQLSRTLLDQPLRRDEWELYEPAVNLARGEDAAAELSLKLRRARGAAFLKTFFSGNTATGKSTEITRLLGLVQDQYRGVRIDIRAWVNPSDLQAHEILLAMVFALNHKMIAVTRELNLQAEPDPDLVQKIADWTRETEYTSQSTAGTDLSAGFGWKALESVGLTFAGQARASHTFTAESREKQRKRFSELMALANSFIGRCYEILRVSPNEPEWVFVIEELDKSPNIKNLIEVVTNQALFKDLQAHLICNIPAAARIGQSLPLADQPIYDVPVFEPDHLPHELGRTAMRRVLEKRAAPDLFGLDQLERVIVAGGGNFRTMFRILDNAGTKAYLRRSLDPSLDPDAGPIEAEDVTRAINSARSEYRDRLGESGFEEPEPFTVPQKFERLLAIYNQSPGSDLPDRLLDRLLIAGAVQVYNGQVRRAVHPLVVDILAEQGLLPRASGELIPGGSI